MSNSIHDFGPMPGHRPITPMPMKKTVEGMDFVYSGVSAGIRKAQGIAVSVHFTAKAASGGDLTSMMKVTLQRNSPIPGGPHRGPTTITANFHSGDSAATCAEKLEAALKARAPTGYLVSRHGNSVRIQEELMMAAHR